MISTLIGLGLIIFGAWVYTVEVRLRDFYAFKGEVVDVVEHIRDTMDDNGIM